MLFEQWVILQMHAMMFQYDERLSPAFILKNLSETKLRAFKEKKNLFQLLFHL